MVGKIFNFKHILHTGQLGLALVNYNLMNPFSQNRAVLGGQKSMFAPIARRWLALRYRIFSRRYDNLVLEKINDVPLVILPQVFNPVLLRTGIFLAETLSAWPLNPSSKVLDLGTGSGVGAIFAARQGAKVTALDINPAAVRCAKINALLNSLEGQIDVIQSDLFTAVPATKFDLICFNPPFHRGQAKNPLDHAWRGQDIFERFTTELAPHLKPQGQALLILSSDGDCAELIDLLQHEGFICHLHRRKDLINEILTAFIVQRKVLC